ncbi:AraC family transcriptional regulator [Raoultibacter massiliensis]|uniref:helix-turn-helix transcriptional regulator n=1 Tax=Raoultibacter massiliensis TaxID=1852371 RepID=UPI003A8F529D
MDDISYYSIALSGSSDKDAPATPYEYKVGFFSTSAGFRPHRHGFAELMYIKGERGVHIIDGIEYPLENFSLFLVLPHQVHSLVCADLDAPRVHYLDFDMGLLLSLLSRPEDCAAMRNALRRSAPAVRRDKLDQDTVENVFVDLLAEFSEGSGLLASATARTSAITAIMQFFDARSDEKPGDRKDDDAWKALEYAISNSHESLTAASVAQRIGWTESAFNAFCKRETGSTLPALVTEVRMQEAASLLTTFPRAGASSIMHLTGYSSQATFFRVFKKTYGCTPEEFRQKLVFRSIPEATGSVPAALSHEILLYIHREICRKLTLCDVAEVFSVNASRLGKDFTEYLGESFNQYVNRLKVIKACPMLSMTDQPIGEISEKVGFSSIRSFRTTFKRYMKKDPAEYRCNPGL